MKTFIAIVLVLAAAAGGWWLFQNGYLTQGARHTQASNQYEEGNLLLGTDATSTLGTYLIGYNGMTLYTYSKDLGGVSNCYSVCAANWPPYLISSREALANVQAGIDGTVDAITREGGAMQVTYNGEPLYFYAYDKVSGDATGEKAGGVWFVAKP